MESENIERLTKIDSLHSLGIAKLISLPQIVVVGDQSSGKSSVLEGLTHLPFPRDAGLCTRFPTQIVFKRSRKTTITASIIPGPYCDEERKETLAAFHKQDLQSMDETQFSKLIGEAFQVMNVGNTNSHQASRHAEHRKTSFTVDVLKIEITGPDCDHFSVIDLPGLFRTPTPGVTTIADMEIVRNMVNDYIKNPRSIIMAVVPANVDIATQEIVQMARTVDPEQRRTLGVLTKPDLVDEGAESKVMELVLSHTGANEFGYSIVCNRSQKHLETSVEERDDREKKFFTSSPWLNLPDSRVGILNLKSRLFKILCQITEKEFFNVSFDMRTELDKLEEELSELGPPRITEAQQRIYLLHIANSFEEARRSAEDGYYHKGLFDHNEDLRLATKIVGLYGDFKAKVNRYGNVWRYNSTCRSHVTKQTTAKDADADDDMHEPGEEVPPDGDDEIPEEVVTSDKNTALNTISGVIPASCLTVLEPKNMADYPELNTIIKSVQLRSSKQQGILQWIEQHYRKTRGYEMGTTNPALLPKLFREQTENWNALARGLVFQAIATIHRFIHELLIVVIDDPIMVRKVWSKVRLDLIKLYPVAVKHADFLVKSERDGHLHTENHYFAHTLQKTRIDKITRQFTPLQHVDVENGKTYISLDDAIGTLRIGENEDSIIQDVHDILKAYHKDATKRFIDNVCKQAVDTLLVTCEESPLKLFSSTYIGEMSSGVLKDLAGEDQDIQQKRQSLVEHIQLLRDGVNLLST